MCVLGTVENSWEHRNSKHSEWFRWGKVNGKEAADGGRAHSASKGKKQNHFILLLSATETKRNETGRRPPPPSPRLLRPTQREWRQKNGASGISSIRAAASFPERLPCDWQLCNVHDLVPLIGRCLPPTTAAPPARERKLLRHPRQRTGPPRQTAQGRLLCQGVGTFGDLADPP